MTKTEGRIGEPLKVSKRHPITPNRFLNDVVKPWDDLNSLLVQRLAFDPTFSDVTRLAGALAVAIKHQADLAGVQRSAVDSASPANRLMSDVGDFWKHGSLKKASRNNSLMVAALFEHAPERGFRFIRNGVLIRHATLGEHDFMAVSLDAISYWVQHYRFNLTWTGHVSEAPVEFHPEAFLYYEPRHCIHMGSTSFRFLARAENGELVLKNPDKCRIAILERTNP